jgi:putative flippase GtrA
MAELVSRSALVGERTRRLSMLMTALRFAVVGAGGVVVNMLVLHVLYAMVHLPLLVASPVAVALAVVHNYLVNNRWTFGLRAGRRWRGSPGLASAR